jgi:hypothetical protein
VFVLSNIADGISIELLVDIAGVAEKYDRPERDAKGKVFFVKGNECKVEDIGTEDSVAAPDSRKSKIDSEKTTEKERSDGPAETHNDVAARSKTFADSAD